MGLVFFSFSSLFIFFFQTHFLFSPRSVRGSIPPPTPTKPSKTLVKPSQLPSPRHTQPLPVPSQPSPSRPLPPGTSNKIPQPISHLPMPKPSPKSSQNNGSSSSNTKSQQEMPQPAQTYRWVARLLLE